MVTTPKAHSALCIWESIIHIFAISMKTTAAISLKIWNHGFLDDGPQNNVSRQQQ